MVPGTDVPRYTPSVPTGRPILDAHPTMNSSRRWSAGRPVLHRSLFTVHRSVSNELACNFGDVAPLRARDLQLVLARQPRAVRSGDCGRAVRGAARDLVHVGEARLAVGHADDDHALVEE